MELTKHHVLGKQKLASSIVKNAHQLSYCAKGCKPTLPYAFFSRSNIGMEPLECKTFLSILRTHSPHPFVYFSGVVHALLKALYWAPIWSEESTIIMDRYCELASKNKQLRKISPSDTIGVEGTHRANFLMKGISVKSVKVVILSCNSEKYVPEVQTLVCDGF